MHDLPHSAAAVGARVPVVGQLVGTQQPHLAAAGLEDAGLDHAVHARVLGLGERLGHAELVVKEAGLLEPGHGPARVGVEIALLLGQRLFQRLDDQRQRIAHTRARGR